MWIVVWLAVGFFLAQAAWNLVRNGEGTSIANGSCITSLSLVDVVMVNPATLVLLCLRPFLVRLMLCPAEINNSMPRVLIGSLVLFLSACGTLIIDDTGQVDTSASKREDFEQCMTQLNQSYQKILASYIEDCKGDQTCKLGAPDWNEGRAATICKDKLSNE